MRLTSWHRHGSSSYHSHGDSVRAGRGNGRGIHGCWHAIGLDHRCMMNDMRRCCIKGLCVISALLLWKKNNILIKCRVDIIALEHLVLYWFYLCVGVLLGVGTSHGVDGSRVRVGWWGIGGYGTCCWGAGHFERGPGSITCRDDIIYEDNKEK